MIFCRTFESLEIGVRITISIWNNYKKEIQNIFCFVLWHCSGPTAFRISQMQSFRFQLKTKNNDLLANEIKFENAIQIVSQRCDEMMVIARSSQENHHIYHREDNET